LICNLLQPLLLFDLNSSVLLNQIEVLLVELSVLLPPLLFPAFIALTPYIGPASSLRTAIFITILNLIIISDEVFELKRYKRVSATYFLIILIIVVIFLLFVIVEVVLLC
jgi:hypothetical protein